jgi:hypothetical protein
MCDIYIYSSASLAHPSMGRVQTSNISGKVIEIPILFVLRNSE